MAIIRWCPIYPKWDSYQPLINIFDYLWEVVQLETRYRPWIAIEPGKWHPHCFYPEMVDFPTGHGWAPVMSWHRESIFQARKLVDHWSSLTHKLSLVNHPSYLGASRIAESWTFSCGKAAYQKCGQTGYPAAIHPVWVPGCPWFYQGLSRYFISQPLGFHFSQVLNSISAPAMELSIQALPASTFWRLWSEQNLQTWWTVCDIVSRALVEAVCDIGDRTQCTAWRLRVPTVVVVHITHFSPRIA